MTPTDTACRHASQALVLRKVWSVLAEINDPEIPLLGIVDLGVVRSVEVDDDTITVNLSPTYTGCPASEVIAADVRTSLRAALSQSLEVHTVLRPAWTTDWISASGRQALHQSGITPPETRDVEDSPDRITTCPRCGSSRTQCVSEFGSTPCKSSYVCEACLEPFERFKCL